MEKRELLGRIAEVKTGRLSRRAFIEWMVGLGLTAPLATQLLAYCGVAHAQTVGYKPMKAGGEEVPF